ncbi:hypothetical protein Dpo_1c05080 [Desulfotignum phosphitoxidans DSM 13687]|uniref:Uncharacterized protein n=1 Tax=Desulfotignum phosphitoxidans DSM 13687 TaxID=1286635 RepID=S0FZG2_9BACT|nr:hypothetical protein Dpo_17c00510 [Desulfotignum phosphitoxidans DSM 13687]EMS81367.1 hypothetical protein Dpo_1c05080 [Desulfotignum phosphitoxidans DSM 13687]
MIMKDKNCNKNRSEFIHSKFSYQYGKTGQDN